ISGTPKNLNTTSRTRDKIKKKICNLYLVKLKFLILSEKSDNSAFRIKVLNTEIPSNTHTLVSTSITKANSVYSITRGKLKIKRALAGVGSPMNESVCRVSILNFAKRIHEPKAMINPK